MFLLAGQRKEAPWPRCWWAWRMRMDTTVQPARAAPFLAGGLVSLCWHLLQQHRLSLQRLYGGRISFVELPSRGFCHASWRAKGSEYNGHYCVCNTIIAVGSINWCKSCWCPDLSGDVELLSGYSVSRWIFYLAWVCIFEHCQACMLRWQIYLLHWSQPP